MGDHVVQPIGDSLRKYVSQFHGISYIRLNPIRLDKGSIIAVLSDFYAIAEGEKTKATLNGGVAYKFKYGGSNKRYRLLKSWSMDF